MQYAGSSFAALEQSSREENELVLSLFLLQTIFFSSDIRNVSKAALRYSNRRKRRHRQKSDAAGPPSPGPDPGGGQSGHAAKRLNRTYS